MSAPLQESEQHSGGRISAAYEMTLPFDPDALSRRVRTQGFSREQADMFAQVALQKLRTLHEETNQPVTPLQIAWAMRKHAFDEFAREAAAEEQPGTQRMTIAEEMEMAAEGDDMTDLEMEEDEWWGDVSVQTIEKDGRLLRRFEFDDESKRVFFGGKDPYSLSEDMENLNIQAKIRNRSRSSGGSSIGSTDIITAMCRHTELAVELGKHLHATDVVNLYSVNRMFHNAVNEHLFSSIKTWIAARAPEAGRMFPFKLYRRLLVCDPAGRKIGEMNPKLGPKTMLSQWMMQRTRSVPGLRYLQLVLGRDRCCREMIAILARNGHRCPPTMHATLLRLWLLMDIATTRQRQALLRNKEIWSDQHLYNAQFFFVKLGMHFNDPIYGPSSYDLLYLMLGQKGLHPLWQLLLRKRFTTLKEVMDLAVRYNHNIEIQVLIGEWHTTDFHGVPVPEIGIGHLEGWGMGEKHLMRPDELVPVEAVTRGLELDRHIRYMMLWGYFDFETGENLVPTEEEMYISDEERAIGHMDTVHHWRRKHVLKKRWDSLTPQQQQEIKEEDEDDRLRAMGFCGVESEDDDRDDDWLSAEDEEAESEGEKEMAAKLSLDDEIRRGFILRPQDKNHQSDVPPLDDQAGWSAFVNEALMGQPPQITKDEAIQAQAWHSYQAAETNCAWDWARWLEHERAKDEAADEEGDDAVEYDDGYSGWIAEELNEYDYEGEDDDNEDVLEDEGDEEYQGHWEHEDDGDEEEGYDADGEEMEDKGTIPMEE